MTGIKNMGKAMGFFILAISTFAGAQVSNCGFEETYEVDAKAGYEKRMEDGQWDFEKPLVFPKGWRLNVPLTKAGKYRLIKDPTQARSGNNCVYLKGHLMYEQSIDVTAGDEFTVSCYVKDPEKKPAGVCFYFYSMDEKGKNIFAGSQQFTVKTGSEWSKQTGSLTIPEESRGQRVNRVVIALFSNTGAYFDDIEVVHKRTTSWLNFEDAFIEGNKKLAGGNFAGAREDYNAGLALTKDRKERIDAFLKIAESYRQEKNYSKEIDTFNTIFANEKPDISLVIEINFKLSDAYLNLKDFEKAREVLAGILKMGKEADGSKVDAQLKIADSYLREKNYPKAIESFEEVSNMKQAGGIVKVSTQFKIGDTYVSARDYDKAQQAYAKILSMPSTTFIDKFEAHRKTGDLYRNEKNYDKAREFYHRALNVGAVNPWRKSSLLSTIAETYSVEGRYEEARRFYRKVIDDVGLSAWNTVKPAYIKIGDTYRKEGNYEKERQVYDEMVRWVETELPKINIGISEIVGVYCDMNRLKGDSYWEQGDKEKAKEYYMFFLEGEKQQKPADKLIKEVEAKIGTNKPAEYIRNAKSLFFEQRYDESKAAYEDVLRSSDALVRQKAVAYMGIGDIYLAGDEFEKARSQYQKVIDMKDVSIDEKVKALMLIGDSYSIEKNYAQARKIYEKVLVIPETVASQKIDAQEKIAEMYRAELNYAQAKVAYEKMLSMDSLSDNQKQEIKQRILTIYR